MAISPDKIKIIIQELKEIFEFSMGIREVELPVGMLPEDKKLVAPVDQELKNAYKLMNEALKLFEKPKDMEEVTKQVNALLTNLGPLSMQPEAQGDSFKFLLDKQVHEIVLERNLMVYLYVYENEDVRQSYFLHTSHDLSSVINLLQIFRSGMLATKQEVENCDAFIEKIKKVADQFRPDWKQVYGLKLPEMGPFGDRLYFSDRDVEEITREFKNKYYGPELAQKMAEEDLHDILKFITDTLAKNPQIKDKILNEQLSVIQDYFKSEDDPLPYIMEHHPEVQEYFKQLVSKYTIRNKLNQIKKELEENEKEMQSIYAAKEKKHKFGLIKEALEKNNVEDFFAFIDDKTPEDQEKLLKYLKEQPDEYFKKRSHLFADAIFNNVLLLDKELAGRISLLVFSDYTLYVDEAMDEAVRSKFVEELAQNMPREMPPEIPVLKPLDPQLQEAAKVIGEAMAEDMYNKYEKEIHKLMDKYNLDEFPEQFAKFIGSHLEEELGKLGKLV